MTSRAKNREGPTSLAASRISGSRGGARRGVFDLLMGVLHHHHRGVHHVADGNGDARQTQNVGRDIELVLEDKGDQDPQGQADNGHKGAAQVQEKENA